MKTMNKSGSPRPAPPLVGRTATMPNYMKPTISSHARNRNPQNLRRKSSDNSKTSLSSCTKTSLATTLTKNKPARASATKCSTVVLCENLDARRATCSSTLKDRKKTCAIKVCSYTYCSLNGHHHAPLLPLESFLLERRRTRAKPVGDSDLIEEENKDFFIEIYGKDDERISPPEDSDMDWDKGAGDNCITDSKFIIESESKGWCFDGVCQESYAESRNSDAFSCSDDGESDNHLQSSNTLESPAPEKVQEEESEKVPQLKSTEAETEERGLARFTAKPKESDELGSSNPRGPNFLPLEQGPEVEKVVLRHQDLDEKKNPEEWMVDYALRRVVTKLCPARKRKVPLLVEAFENINVL